MRTMIAVVTGFIMFLIAVNQVYASDSYYTISRTGLEDDPSVVVNRPVNVQGLTGLIMTNSA